MVHTVPGVTEYTTDILDRNFLLLDSFMTEAAETIWAQSEAIVRLSKQLDHVSELAHKAEKATKIVVKAKRSKLFVIGVVAGSAYLGYKVAQSKFEASFQGPLYVDKKPANTQPTNETEKD